MVRLQLEQLRQKMIRETESFLAERLGQTRTLACARELADGGASLARYRLWRLFSEARTCIHGPGRETWLWR